MRVVVQRVSSASVTVHDEVVGAIERGLLVLVGVGPEDSDREIGWMAKKIAGLRIFPDESGRMNRSVLDVEGGVLAISQFTLYGDVRKGRRPSFVGAAPPERAEPLYLRFLDALRAEGISCVQAGVFAADMSVALVNEGPVTLIVDSP
ncbi:MAG: D-tyrosyl-tRNA(Tyr) deacylase [Deltaproteobacteria bacterium]|nr:MAG: D-tyrosyl-tRNA(Tyr) deacylase [Deltaproteobacteria bacterium]